MGERGQALVFKRYTWPVIAEQTLNSIQTFLEETPVRILYFGDPAGGNALLDRGWNSLECTRTTRWRWFAHLHSQSA